MNQILSSEIDVLIVGAGPTGLVLASELLRRGVHCRVIDKLDAYATSSRGHGLQPRSLEILDNMGIVDKMLTVGTTHFRTKFFSEGNLILDLDMAVKPRPDAPYLSALVANQPPIEGVLRDHLMSLGGAVELSCELTQLQQDKDVIIASVDHKATGKSEQIRAAYLVGCDGGHSSVRKLLDLKFEGESVAEHFVLGDMEINWDLEPSRDLAYWYLHENGMMVAGSYTGAPTWNVLAQIPANADGKVEPASIELFDRLIAERTGKSNARVIKASWLSNFSINRRMVNHYRHGRAFVAGDAAHVHSPSGGQGMNTGMQDAFNLAWKLALVLRGKAPETLLNTYEEERLPIAKAVLRETGSRDSIYFAQSPVMNFIRKRIAGPLLNQPTIKEMFLYKLAELNINYRASSLAQDYESPLGPITLLPIHQAETPNLRDWFDFRSAPHAGDRAPRAHGQRFPTQTATSLFEIFRSGTFTLLLFGGPGQTTEGDASLVNIAQSVDTWAGDEVKSYIVIAGSDKPKTLDWSGSILLDPEHEMHKTYGAGAQSLYLIRPDGYVAFRSQPVDWEPLASYLGKLFLQRERTEVSSIAH